ncbi:MAG TPA: DUF2269 family protein [Acidimicrobiales bacterium]|jgi:uncharacterized membrane protein|nr:DUF2269 family protein [Acidimicrobiales bacterium]
MGLGTDGGLYRLLLLLHILTAAVGFGAVAFNGLARMRARQRDGEAELLLLEENAYLTRVAEYLIYAAFVFGLLVGLSSKGYWDFTQSWLSLAMLLYLVEIGVLHGIIHRAEHEYEQLLVLVNATGGEGHPEVVGQLEQLEKRIRVGWGAFDVLFLMILYLMVFTPGHVRVG